MKIITLISLLALTGGCSSDAQRNARFIHEQEEMFARQSYSRRSGPAVEETDAFFTFTNRLSQRDTEPMDLADLGKVMVLYYGTNIAWRVVTTAFADYSGGAPLSNATNVMWLVGQSPRTRDTAWMVHFKGEWLK